MGHRHNRRRYRSHGPNKFGMRVNRLETIEGLSLAAGTQALPSDPDWNRIKPASDPQCVVGECRHTQCRWQVLEQEQERRRSAARLEAEQRRVFGGEDGDEVSLCGPMLQVVLSLFGGVDYVDP